MRTPRILTRHRRFRPLEPHAWDTPEKRAAIYDAFDRWFVAYEAGETLEAARWRQTLRFLTTDAKRRLRARTYGHAVLMTA